MQTWTKHGGTTALGCRRYGVMVSHTILFSNVHIHCILSFVAFQCLVLSDAEQVYLPIDGYF